MAFKLGKEVRQYRTPEDTPIVRKKLDKGILGEANNDGTINVDSSVKPGSAKEKEVIGHEKVHMQDMESGKLAYGDHWIRYNGKTYPRKGGKIKYNGKWKVEGHSDFPWEKRADKSPNKYHDDISKEKNPEGWAKSHRTDGTARSGMETKLINDALSDTDISLAQAIAAAEKRIEELKDEQRKK